MALNDGQYETQTGKRIIRFYRVSEMFGGFSNFAPYQIRLNDRTWPTTEHYFQAQKFAGTWHEEEIRRAKRAFDAAQMGRDPARPVRPDWDQVKDDIMREAVTAKFEQHRELRQILLDTEDAILVEHTSHDAYWGDGGDGKGKNMLGNILMDLRNELRKQSGNDER